MQAIEQFAINQLPKWMSLSQSLLPKKPQAMLLEALFNQLFAAELAAGELDFLSQRCLLVMVDDWQLSLYIRLQGQRLQLSFTGHSPDVSMGSDWQAFCLMIHQRVDPDTLFFNRRLRLTGDTELGLYVKNFLDGLDLRAKLPEPLYRAGQRLADQLQAAAG